MKIILAHDFAFDYLSGNVKNIIGHDMFNAIKNGKYSNQMIFKLRTNPELIDLIEKKGSDAVVDYDRDDLLPRVEIVNIPAGTPFVIESSIEEYAEYGSCTEYINYNVFIAT